MKTSIVSLMVAAACVAASSAETPAVDAARQAETLYQQGRAAEKAGNPVAAQQAYAAALKANPGHANARFSLGQIKLNSGAVAAKGREAKLAAVVIPTYRLDEATLQDALDALRISIERQAKDKLAPNFIVQDPEKKLAAAKISLNLKNTPATAVLQYLMEAAGGKARFDEHAVVITAR